MIKFPHLSQTLRKTFGYIALGALLTQPFAKSALAQEYSTSVSNRDNICALRSDFEPIQPIENLSYEELINNPNIYTNSH